MPASDGTLYVSLLASAGLALVPCGALVWRRRDRTGAPALFAFCLSVSAWCLLYAAAIASSSVASSYRWFRLMFVLAVLSSGAWLYVSLRYSGRHDWAGPRTVGFLLVLPAIVLVSSLVPVLEPLVFAEVEPAEAAPVGFDIEFGPLGSVVALANVVMWLVATLLLCQLFVRSRHLYRREALAVLVAALVPWATILVYTVFVSSGIDPGPLGLSLSAGALTVACYRRRLLDLSPSGRDAVVDEMDDGAIVLDIDERIGDANAAAETILGIDRATAIGRNAADVFEAWAAIKATDDDHREWHELARAVDGTTRYLEATTSTFVDQHDEPAGYLVLVRDVTHRKERELDLARYKTIFESVQDRVYVLDDRNRFVLVNESLATMLGYDAEELRGESFTSILPVSADEPDDEWVPRNESGDDDERLELRIETADGTVIPCETSRSPIAFEGDLQGTVGIVRDISERKRIERDLDDTSRALETLVEASPAAIVATDPLGRIEVWNPAAESIFGWERGDVLGKRPPFVRAADVDRFERIHSRVLDGEHVTGAEEVLWRRDGSTLHVSISAAPQRDSDGHVSRVVSVIVDISDLKAYERALESKNEQLEEFASTLSHDLRNPLSVATGFLALTRETGDDNHLEQVELALERIDELIDDLLALARAGEQTGERDTHSLRAVAETAWATVDTGDATLEIAGSNDYETDRSQLLQLLENVFRNAVEHAASERGDDLPTTATDGGGLTVTVGTTDTGFYVADDGPGIPESDREAVFEQGYTTAPAGTGLGLSIVARIAEAHGWTVSVREAPETGGARFEFDVD